jgi:hypothetical protein
MDPHSDNGLEDSLLLHLLEHRGHQVRFEADQWTTEFGIIRAFPELEVLKVKVALRSLEMGRSIYRRVQYVIGYSEPKLVFSLTPSGHRKALVLRRRQQGLPELPDEDGTLYPLGSERAELAPDANLPPNVGE